MKSNTFSSRLLMSAAAFALVAGASAIAGAQTYGMATLGPGMPAQSMTGMSGQPGAELQASMYGTQCWGNIPAAPQHIVTVTQAGMVNLTVTATDSGDTTLTVVGPGGTFCDDDTNGFNPAISEMLAPGAYSVWVGSYSAGTTHPYGIEMSMQGTAMPTGQVGPHGLMATNTPEDVMGPINLATGFMPDPQMRSGVAGGPVAAGGIPNNYGGTCRGYTQAMPDHVMVTTTPFNFLRVFVQSQGDPTLIIQDPNGTYWCNDDADGFQPAITGPWAAGTWRIWVGAYSNGEQIPYTIGFTEYQ